MELFRRQEEYFTSAATLAATSSDQVANWVRHYELYPLKTKLHDALNNRTIIDDPTFNQKILSITRPIVERFQPGDTLSRSTIGFFRTHINALTRIGQDKEGLKIFKLLSDNLLNTYQKVEIRYYAKGCGELRDYT